jgi:hypothetical protein
MKITVDELLPRIRVQTEGNTWSVIIFDDQDLVNAIEELVESIKIFLECKIQNIDVSSAKIQFISEIESDTDYILLWNFGNWTNTDWQELDYMRSSLDKGKRGGILILSQSAVEKMSSYAPNFSSWVGGRIFQMILGAEFLTTEESQSRLEALREWAGKSDAEIIELAEAHHLPSEPEYGEWLILLGRGDLIGH